MLKTYSKHKDRNPVETAERIRGILKNHEIETEIVASYSQYGTAFANRVQLAGISAGTNGKGLGAEYALASGYAELMERLQNDWLVKRSYHTEHQKEFGFYHFPDERLAGAEEIFASDDGILARWLSETGVRDDEMQQLICDCARLCYAREDGRIPVAEYTDAAGGQPVFLPLMFVKILIASNGMSAGNTLPEALVQGMSELFERYAESALIRRELTPPEIPEEYLRFTGIWDLIGKLQESGRFRVKVLDCSLGRQFPVACVIISDLSSGRFGVRFGAHPSMAVAVERTLTEAFQGKSPEEFASSNATGPAAEVLSPFNIELLLRTGYGFYPASIFGDRPDWAFRPWGVPDERDNGAILAEMLKLADREGFRVLLRDNSWLGFPACHIVIPGMSEVSAAAYRSAEDYRREFLFQNAMSRFPDLTPEEEDAVLYHAQPFLKISDFPEPDPLRRPLLEGVMSKEKIFGFLFLKREAFAEAAAMFRTCRENAYYEQGKAHWKAMTEYAVWRGEGISREKCVQLLHERYPESIASRVAEDTRQEDMLRRRFPAMRCYDCENCRLTAGKMCNGLREKEIFRKVAKAIGTGEVTQESMRILLSGIGR